MKSDLRRVSNEPLRIVDEPRRIRVHPCDYTREPLRVEVRCSEDRRRTFFDHARTSKDVARTLRSLSISLEGRTLILQGSGDILQHRRETLGASRAILGDRRPIPRESSAIAGGRWRSPTCGSSGYIRPVSADFRLAASSQTLAGALLRSGSHIAACVTPLRCNGQLSLTSTQSMVTRGNRIDVVVPLHSCIVDFP